MIAAPRSCIQSLKILSAPATEIARISLVPSGKIGSHLPEQQAAGFSRVALFDPSIKLIDDHRAWEAV